LDFNTLTGPQRKIVRMALLDAFDEDTLDLLLSDELDKPPMRNLVAKSSFEIMVGDLVRKSVAQGWADKLIESARVTSQNVRLSNLPAALEIAAVEREPGLGGQALESIVRTGDYDDFTLWATRFAEIQRWICRIEYPKATGVGYGTGLLVAPDLVLTNHHVIEDHEKGTLDPRDVRCRFDYSVGAGVAPGGPVALHGDWLAGFSPSSPVDPGDRGGTPDPAELDYALLRLARRVGDDTVGNGPRGVLPLNNAAPAPTVADIIFIAQHPNGEPLKVSVGVVQSREIRDGLRIRYDANTSGGSSGSPCFDRSLNLVALHHGGDPNWRRPEFNQGVPIALITADFAARGLLEARPQ
jgi:hypothetical protein